MNKQIGKLAYQGNWEELLQLLRQAPELVDSASEEKRYTPLHQAAWHGAGLAVIGELLSLGANREVTTYKGQTPADIAREKHPERGDLQYVLAPAKRTLAQLLRKVQADNPDFFGTYDGNQIVLDRLIDVTTSEVCEIGAEDVESKLSGAFQTVTGLPISFPREASFYLGEHFKFTIDPAFWRNRFLPVLVRLEARAHLIPIEQDWAVISDIFDPVPENWGLRGDMYLWIEMRQALCHVEIPSADDMLAQAVSAAFASLTGEPLERSGEVRVKRLSRGGMSSGMVSGEFWCEHFIPLLKQRANWLRESWAWQGRTFESS